ncbi:hypothetical protein QBC47DRAFT_142345 [Echria macrotheca]|uniref:Uncharacterized protein n=1 Tax=Echria macrotheca TaxID=438768 RepID=A0AAJ0FES6_9PEZI|nr:hypothetical protein QBC47DRAFT_142345 [Echria macrotheca]
MEKNVECSLRKFAATLFGIEIQGVLWNWVDDLEIPGGESLQIKRQDSSQFPEVLRQIGNSTFPSPPKQTKPSPSSAQQERKESRPIVLAGLINLDQFRDSEDDDFFGDPIATIKDHTQLSQLSKGLPEF